MRSEGHSALVHTAAASNLGQMLSKLCLADGVELVNIVRSPAQGAILEAIGARHIVDSTAPDFPRAAHGYAQCNRRHAGIRRCRRWNRLPVRSWQRWRPSFLRGFRRSVSTAHRSTNRCTSMAGWEPFADHGARDCRVYLGRRRVASFSRISRESGLRRPRSLASVWAKRDHHDFRQPLYP